MAAPKGNQYYLLRSKDGRDKIFKTPAALAKKCNEYFEWCLNTPLYEAQVVKGTTVETTEEVDEYGNLNPKKKTLPYAMVSVPKMRPFTLEGLCNFIDISLDAFKNYEKREDYIAVTTRVRQIIENQQLEGAAAGFLNPSIIARKLGLADKKDTNITGSVTFLEALKNARGRKQ